jgi:hypothetical protein
MNQSKIASRILNMLDEQKRRSALFRARLLLLASFVVFMWASGSDSPLAVIPRTFFGVLLGYLLLYAQSIRIYPSIAVYFNVEALERDALRAPSSMSSKEIDQ